MGLRSDAEAARLAAIEHRASRENARRRENERLEQTRRAGIQQRAIEALRAWGVEIVDSVWIEENKTRPYGRVEAVPTLLLRSDDGVWLRCTETTVTLSYKTMFHVVDKCPTCDQWIGRGGGLASTLAQIGDQLAIGDASLVKHHEEVHNAPLPEQANGVLVYACAWRPLDPDGEPAPAGFDWDVHRDVYIGAAAMEARAHPNVEYVERRFFVHGMKLDEHSRELIGDRIDQHFWDDFGGRYDTPVHIADWEG